MTASSDYEADICLILEGTYPYVRGGVSSWVHSIVKGLPDFTFSLLVILPDKQPREMRYELPSNIKKMHTMYLQDKSLFKKPFWTKALRSGFSQKQLETIWKLHLEMPFVEEEAEAAESFSGCPEFAHTVHQLHAGKWDPATVLYDSKSWDLLVQLYHVRNSDVSFIDYFWTWRYLHAGIFAILRQDVPRCRMYHTISTGYAGLLAAKAKVITDAPMMVTEHGIYSKERRIEISRASWIFEKSQERFMAEKRLGAFKQIWINAFRAMSYFCYEQADEIITLYTGNQRLQLEDGAPPEKLRVIPNGVDFSRLSALPREPQGKPIIGFVGRVVSIKDVKTFIRAIRVVVNMQPNAEVWVMGPTEEEPEYYEECVQLVDNLNLQQAIRFTGNVNLMEYYPKIDVLVLTSISEGQPLVILEAQCLGIPVVASDVGSCRDLLEGMEADRHLGAGGIITGLADPEETAMAILSILKNREKSTQMGEAGKQRMQQFYDLPILYQKYHDLYQTYCYGRDRV